MNYDFDAVIERKNTNSIKFDFARERGMPEGLLPLWVADMDFPAPPAVLSALRRVLKHGIFGYSAAKPEYYDALSAWFSSRFGFSFTKEEVIQSPGVVFAIAQGIRAFTRPGDGVLIQTPVYYPFYSLIRDNGRRIVRSPLFYQNEAYGIDFSDFEKKIRTQNVRLFLLCSPHNPVGRVFTREELEHMRDICKRYGVLVLSDEIHCDFVYPGYRHLCYGRIDDEAIVATAPSKTFNLAGLQVSNIVVKNEALRRALTTEIEKTGYSQLNTFGLAACQSAYRHGGEWLESLLSYLTENIRTVRWFLSEHLPKVRIVEPEGTYLVWLDFSAYALSQNELDERIVQRASLWLDSGTMFGEEGEGFERINIACPRKTLLDALFRLKRAFGA